MNHILLYYESKDGIHWTPPKLGLHTLPAFPEGSVIMADHFGVEQTFAASLDKRPGIPPAERYKGIGGKSYHAEKLAGLTAKYGTTGLRAFVSPDGIHWQPMQKEPVIPAAWENRANYAAYHIVSTSPTEISIYATAGRRYTLRTDGFVSIHAPLAGGELVTKPLVFDGKKLILNFATSAAGQIRVELQDEKGMPIPGFTLADCKPIIGDAIERAAAWTNGNDLSALAGKAVKLHFEMSDADLFSIRFR